MTELARVTTLEDIVRVAKIRRSDLGLSQLALDDISGMQTGYTGKLECGDKGLGKLTLPLLLGGLKLELALVPAVRARSTHRDKTGQSEDYFSRRARKAAKARWDAQTPKQRRKTMSAVAKARWAKVKAERERSGVRTSST